MPNQWNLEAFFKPRGIAVVGASPNGGAGTILLDNLQRIGYAGKVFPINPKYTEIMGHKCYASLDDLPADAPVDFVALLVGSQRILGELQKAAARHVPAAWALASGFAETGEEGKRLQAEVCDFCHKANIAFCGPNSIGHTNFIDDISIYSAPIPNTFSKGHISVIAQSGAVLLVLGNAKRGVGFARFISAGNEAVLDTADYMEWLVKDPQTKVIGLFIETIRRPEAFMLACRHALEAGKPVVVLKVGRSDLAKRITVTHTGSIAGNDALRDALFRRLGVTRVDTLDEFLECLVLFEAFAAEAPASRRIAMTTASGGETGMLADLCADRGMVFPALTDGAVEQLRKVLPPYSPLANPLDAWGTGDLRTAYPAAVEILAREQAVDMMVVTQDIPANMSAGQIEQYADVARAAVAARQKVGKPTVLLSNISGGIDETLHSLLREGGVPVLMGSREGLRALAALADYGQFRKQRAECPDEAAAVLPGELAQKLPGQGGMLSYALSLELLAAFGIRPEGEKLCSSVDEAIAAAELVGYPVAVKAIVDGMAHKTENDVIRLNVKDADGLRKAWDEVCASARRNAPDAALEGVLIQHMVSSPVAEMLVGITTDPGNPEQGAAVVLGMGGIFAEILHDSTVEIAPLGRNQATDMLGRLKGHALLEGYRGRPRADTAALVELLTNVGRMASALASRGISLDLNPVMVMPQGQGVRFIDVVVTLAPLTTERRG